jgi:DNA-binding GntR family transcriptional regulator
MASKRATLTPAIERRPDTVARVATEIRNAILQGRLLPGERIRQDALAEQFGVSRIPIREALKTLATVGLLEHTLNAGFAVARLDESELVQIYLLRLLIEDELMKPLPPMTKKQIGALRQVNADMAAASADGDIVEMVTLNRQFHFAMFQATGMKVMLDVLARLWDLSMPYHSTYLYDAQTRERVIHEHDLLLAALESGDDEAYRQIAADHRKNSEVHLLRTLRQQPFLQRRRA